MIANVLKVILKTVDAKDNVKTLEIRDAIVKEFGTSALDLPLRDLLNLSVGNILDLVEEQEKKDANLR